MKVIIERDMPLVNLKIGDIVDIDDNQGNRWIRHNLAKIIDEVPIVIKPIKKIEKIENEVSIGFVTLQNKENDKVASTRLRVTWALPYLKNSFVSENYEELKQADVVVFQSRHEIPDIKMAERLKADGVKLIWDFTDPHWLKEYDPNAIHPIFHKIAQLADVVTLPTEEEARTYKLTFPHVPTEILKDRLELSEYPAIKRHTKNDKFKICWHGSYGNFSSIDLARQDLEKLGKEFDITFICVYDTGNIHNRQVNPFKNLKLDIRTWTNDVTTQALLESDVSINPKFDNHWKSYKSNNKTITSWACGVPCIERNFYDEIKKYFLNVKLRNEEAIIKREIIEKEYDVRLTAKEWINIATKLATVKEKKKKNIVVYTSIVGGKDNLRDDQFETYDADFIAFLDKPQPTNVWQVKKIFKQFIDPSRQAKIYKVFPYLYMDYEYSIWMDGRMALRVSPKELIETYLKDADIALFRHFQRDDIYEEYQADVLMVHRQHEPEYLFRIQQERYAREDFPKHSGLFECTVILRRHTEPVKRLMEMWWSEISAYTVCDQCSFIYCVKKTGIKINVMPGNVWTSPLFSKGEHLVK